MKRLLLACAALLLGSHAAVAQDQGRVGLAMGAPANAMLLWHITDRFAVVPKVAFSSSETETVAESNLSVNGVVVASYTIATRSEGWSISPGFDLRIYVAAWENVRAYVAPGYAYSRGSNSITISTNSPFATVPAESRDVTTSGHDVRGVFGVEYTPHRRFGVYGELGLRRSSSSPRSPALAGSIANTSSSLVGNTSAVGAIFYF